MLGTLFHEVLYRPLLNALIALYDFLPGQDLGIAIIVLTVLVRLLLSPLLNRQVRSQKALTALQPKIAEIRKTTKDQAEQSRRMLALYKQHGVNPAAGCLPLVVQLPVLWAMYAVLRDGLSPDALGALYAFVPRPETINALAFGFLDLARPAFVKGAGIFWPAVILAVLTGVVTYWQTKLLPTTTPHTTASDATTAEQAMHRMSRQMVLIMPLMTVYFSLTFPAGLALYWFVTTFVSILQQRSLLSRHGPSPEA